jgi:hypothetical protein
LVESEANGQLHVLPVAPKPFRREGLGYIYEPPSSGVRFHVDRISRERDGMRARIEVASTLPGLPPHIYQGRHLLEGSRSIADLKKALEEIESAEPAQRSIRWGAYIRELTKAVVDAEERGAPLVHISEIADTAPPADLVRHLITAGKTSVLYGPGGYGKGWIAVGLAVSVALGYPFAGLEARQGTVVYLDWEDDEYTFRQRVRAICAGIDARIVADRLPIHYRRCERPLADDVDFLSGAVDRLGAVLTVVDSVEMASSATEHTSYNDRATAMQRSLRLLRSSHLLIDHVSDAGRRADGLAGKAINGIMKGNLARNQWEIKRDQEVGALVSHVGLYQTKTNHTAQLAPIGLHLDFRQEGAVSVTREDVRASDTLAAPLPLAYRIDGELRKGVCSVPNLAVTLDAKENSILVALRRGAEKGRYVEVAPAVPAKGVPAEWGLAANT